MCVSFYQWNDRVGCYRRTAVLWIVGSSIGMSAAPSVVIGVEAFSFELDDTMAQQMAKTI